MNIFDVGIILLLVLFLIVGFKNGVVKELVALVGIIAVFIIAYIGKTYLGNLLCFILPFFKFTGSLEGLTTINILIYQIISFMIIFSILLSVYIIVLKISKFLQKIVNFTLILWLPSKFLGSIVSLVKGYIVLFAVFLVLLIPLKNNQIYNESTLVNFILYKTPIISSTTSNFTNSIESIYKLADDIKNQKISINQANLETIDIMLKYKVTTKETIEKLIKLHKLDNIKNIEEVLNKY